MITLIFQSKITAEILPFTISFADVLPVGDTIVTPTVTISVYSGTDATPSAILNGSPTVNAAGNAILFSLTGGIAGVIYIITVKAVTAGSNTFDKVGYLAVTSTGPI